MHGDIWAPVTILFPHGFGIKASFLMLVISSDLFMLIHTINTKTLSNRNDLGARIIHVTANGRMSILACVY